MTELGGGIIAIEGARKPPTNLRFVFIKRFRNYLNKYSGIYNYSLREVLYSNSSIGFKNLRNSHSKDQGLTNFMEILGSRL